MTAVIWLIVLVLSAEMTVLSVRVVNIFIINELE